MGYTLENQNETTRLDRQSKLKNYDCITEFENFTFKPHEKILDAGCGSGILARHLVSKWPLPSFDACDISDVRLKQAQALSQDYPSINFFKSDLTNIRVPDNSYDVVICRYVMQHLPKPTLALKEFKRILHPEGRLILIDTDTLAFELATQNTRLNNYLKTIREKIKIHLNIGRHLPAMLHNLSYANIKWNISPMIFQHGDLEHEHRLMQERFEYMREHFCDILGSSTEFEEFKKLYLSEMLCPYNVLFYNKFSITAQKNS